MLRRDEERRRRPAALQVDRILRTALQVGILLGAGRS